MVWRQQWPPASEDERWVRITAAVGSLLVHLVLTVMLAWLMYLRLFMLPAPTETSVVKVQYIGEGTPESLQVPVPSPRETPAEPASSVQDTPMPEAPDAPMPATPTPASVAIEPTPDVAIPMPEMIVPSPPAPVLEIVQPSTPVVEQPLVVTEVAQPDIEFVLVEPTPPTLELTQPNVAMPELTIPVTQVEPAEIKPVQVLSLPSISVPETVAPQPAPLPLPQQPRREAPQPVDIARAPLEIPNIVPQPMQELTQSPLLEVQPQSPAPAVEPVASTPPTTVSSAAESVVNEAEQNAPQTSSQAAAQAPSAPAQNVQSPPPDAWPTPTRGDDWGDALTARPGSRAGQPPGLFDEDGRPRLANSGDKPVQGAAPGTAEQQAIDLDRAETWLKKSGYSYTPTRFDRYWIPGGNLLEEWVRRGIKQVSIPIPGTSKRIDCVVSMLQLGGGCMLADDDLNNQPATARPPPDIPFKPELQENQEALAEPVE